jgi:hypothetical protein
MSGKSLRRTLLTTAMLIAFSLSEVLGAAKAFARDGSGQARGVGNYIYNDVLRPHGRARSNDDEHADAYVCDGGEPRNIGTSTFDACMRGRGWRFARFELAPASSGGGVPDWAWTCPFANC